MYKFKSIYLLFLLLLLNSCSGCTNEESQSNTTVESIEENSEYRLGNLNGDAYGDSVVFDFSPKEGSDFGKARISVFFGTKEGKYNFFKNIDCENSMFEFGSYIHGDTLTFSNGDGIRYNFKYRDNDFYLLYYEDINLDGCKYYLDFKNKKMTFILDPGLDPVKGNDTTYYRSIDIPQDRIPSSFKIDDCFKEDFKKYIKYDESFLKSKVDEYVKEINGNFYNPKSTVLDNDTILFLSEEIKGEDYNTYSISVSIDRKGMTPTLKNLLEAEMCKMLAQDKDYEYDNVADAYDARKKDWYGEFDFESAPYYQDNYFIINIGAHNDLVTYNISTFHYDQYSGRGLENDRFITYNKNTGESFTWDMVNKEDGLHDLMVEGLMKHFNSESVEDMWVNEEYKRGEYIPFPKNPPFIINDSLILQFHRFEITGTWGAGWPSVTIALDKVVPYLTEEGKRFLDIK